MDEQRAWIRARRKRRLRITAAILAFCLLTTTYPNILETISVFAAGLRGDGGAMSITGFVDLPEETAKQSVPVGTDISELELPDTLEAYVTVADKNDTEDDRKPDDGDQDKDDGEDDGDSGQNEGDQENPDEGAYETGDSSNETGDENDGTENPDEDDDNGGDDKENTGGEESPGVNNNDADSEEESAEENSTNTQSTDTDVSTDTDSAANTKSSVFGIQTGSFVMPVYMSGNPQDALTVETLENTLPEESESVPDTDNGGTADHTERNAETKTVTIEGVTWQSEPAYNGDVEETYIFTAVLPEGYALAEGVSLPQITVTVQDDAAVLALIERIEALPEPEEYLAIEPDIDDWEGDEDAYEEAYREWMEGLLAYAEEALAIWEEYEALTKEQQAQIPEELLAKLTAWVELAEQVAGSRKVMAAATHTCNGITFQPWESTTTLPSSGDRYLTNNVNLSASSHSSVTGTLNLCLDGMTIKGENREGMYAILQVDGGTLNLYDHGSGKVYVTGHNAVSVGGNGTANIYGGTFENGGTLAAVNIAYLGSDYSGGTLNIYGGSIKGGRGIHVADVFTNASVSVHGGTVTGSVDGIRMVCGNLTLAGGTINGGSSYAVKAEGSATVTVAGNAALNTAIYTEKSIIASGTGKSGLSTTYKIFYNNVKDGDVVVTGSTDTTHYQLDSDDYGLVASGGNLIAKKKYSITYEKNGGTIENESDYTSYTSGVGLTLPTPTKTGYTFGGWYTSSGLTGTAKTSITTTDTGNKTYYAKWTAKSYTITYKDKNNATFSGTHGSNYPTKHTYGTATTLVSPTKTGYDFNGWYTKSDCTGSSVTSLGATAYTDNITLYAKWTAKTYTVTYNKNNGTIANESNYTSYTYGAGLTLPTPTRTGYTFGGWYTSSALTGTKQTSISTTATGAKTYYAKWTANTYTVTYNKDGGTIADESSYESYTYGTGLTLPTPTRAGYTFGGWYGDSGMTGTAVTKISTSDIGDKAYYAKWTAAAVTINATNCTHDGADKVGENGDYSVTFTPESGYSIPARVTVRIGSTTLASDAYTYDNTTGALTIPRDKITGDITITAKAVKNPVKSGPGKDDPDNTAPGGEPDEDGGKVTYTGTYGEEYTPVIKAGGQEVDPGAEITWDEGEGKGEWSYRADPDDEITVEFRKRAVTGITVTPSTLTIYADDAANESIAALTAYLKEHSSAQASYDNQTKGAVQADYATTDSFAVMGRTYSYTASADGKTAGITLKVAPVTAAATAPAELMRVKKAGGYTAAEVAAWLPAQVTVTYTGDGYTARTESRAVTWDTDSLGTDFGETMGRKTVNGTVAMPEWATGQDSVSIGIEFIDKNILTDAQMGLSISGWTYGAQTAPAPQGSITVADTGAVYSYRYSADNGTSWGTADSLPKSGSGNIIPGTYLVEMTYTGDNYTGSKRASFTVAGKPLTVEKGTLEVEKRNYDGTTDATLKEGGEPALSGVVEGDTVTPGGTLSAVFTKKGPGKNIPVNVTGFELEGRDAGYYELKSATLTLYATINNADGTPPSSGGNGGGNGDGENGGGNGSDDSGDGSGDNGGSTPGDDKDPGTPPVTPPADKTQPVPGTEGSPDKDTETQPAPQPGGKPEQSAEPKDTDAEDTDKPGQDSDPAQPEDEKVQTVPAVIADGRIVVDDGSGSGDGSSTGSGNPANGGKIATGNVPGMAGDGSMPKTSTLLAVGDGAVIVTVVCEDEGYAAGVRDTAAVANAVLTPEQIQLVNNGGTIEVRIDVKDISDSIPMQDKETVEKGCEAYGQYLPDLTLGAYVDISVYIKTGESGWNAVTETKEPIEVVIGVPEELRDDAREYYIIRAHEGRHDLLNDMDDVSDTITIITDRFSSYAIAYRLTGTADTMYGGVEIVDGVAKCRLCHICPTFRGVCCFIWLVVIVVVVVLMGLILYLGYFCITYRRRQRQESKNSVNTL